MIGMCPALPDLVPPTGTTSPDQNKSSNINYYKIQTNLCFKISKLYKQYMKYGIIHSNKQNLLRIVGNVR